MDKRMMLAWLAEQAKKQELTTTKMQQKRLGIKEEVYPPRPEPGILPDKKPKPKPRPLFPGLPLPAGPREPFYDTPLAPKELPPLPVKPMPVKPPLSSTKLQENAKQRTQPSGPTPLQKAPVPEGDDFYFTSWMPLNPKRDIITPEAVERLRALGYTDEQIGKIQRNYPSLGSEWQQKLDYKWWFFKS